MGKHNYGVGGYSLEGGGDRREWKKGGGGTIILRGRSSGPRRENQEAFKNPKRGCWVNEGRKVVLHTGRGGR